MVRHYLLTGTALTRPFVRNTRVGNKIVELVRGVARTRVLVFLGHVFLLVLGHGRYFRVRVREGKKGMGGGIE